MRNTDGSRSKPAMFQTDPPTEAIIERAQGAIAPGRKLSRSEVLRHFAAHWAATATASLSAPSASDRGAVAVGHSTPKRAVVRVETATLERYHRLLAASGISEAALVRQLGLSSRGKLQHALRRGEVPPEVEAWMRAQEAGAR